MSRPLALVTGASAGIGQSFAEQLAPAGHDLIVVARRRDRLEALAQRLGAAHQAKVESPGRRSGHDGGHRRGRPRARAEAPLDLLINNAGFGGYRRFVELDPKVADDARSPSTSARSCR